MMSNDFGERDALRWAERISLGSGCQHSKRGVVIWEHRPGQNFVAGSGTNGPPYGHFCDGTDACRADCGRTCVHAEARALRQLSRLCLAGTQLGGFHMLHVKTVDGNAVPSGPPSCVQCSALLLDQREVEWMWLLHYIEDADTVANPDILPPGRLHRLQRYSVAEFHQLSLHFHGLARGR